jgi:hypothetical protein
MDSLSNRVVREFPVKSVYFTPTEVQDIVTLMDGYIRLSFSIEPDETQIKNINDSVWDTMQRAYHSLTEEV